MGRDGAQEITGIRNRINLIMAISVFLTFTSLIVELVFKVEYPNAYILATRFILMAFFLSIYVMYNFRLKKFKNEQCKDLVQSVKFRLFMFFCAALLSFNVPNWVGIFIRENLTLNRIIGITIVAIMYILTFALIDAVTREKSEAFGDEFSQKIRDEGGRNAFYLSVLGLGAFQITMAVWVDFKNGIAAHFGAQAIDVSIIVSVFILLASWAIGQLYARGKYR